jgi:hypothetical protein
MKVEYFMVEVEVTIWVGLRQTFSIGTRQYRERYKNKGLPAHTWKMMEQIRILGN